MARRSRQPRHAGVLWRWRRFLFAPILIVFASGSGGLYWLSRAPLPAPHSQTQTTFVYDSTGQLLATFSEQNRVDVTLSQVPKIVIDAVVSTEDRHFFTEGAIDPLSIVRAAFADLTGSGTLQGGSTITQQYVKQAYLNPKRTITRKLEEALVAIRLSRDESKDEILQNYLNTIYWGRGAYGVEAAAEAYFGKGIGALDLREASLLAGMIREPSLADPALNAMLARQNQDDTLLAMERDHYITPDEAAGVRATPFASYVIAPSASSTQVSDVAGDAYFIAAVRQELYDKYGQAMVDGGGLRVYTTLDPAMQAKAYATLYGNGPEALDPAAGDPSAALVSIDDSGDVKALVGGQNYATSAVDLALGAEGGGSGRQAGSTFKAFMLAEVIKLGYSVESVFPAPPEVVVPNGSGPGVPWSVTNYEHEAEAPMMSLIDATALSVNTVYAQVVDRIGAQRLDSMAEAMGINPQELTGAYPSQVLGSADVSPLEMAGGYATLADGGVYHTPLLITKVTSSSGQVLPLPVAPSSKVVLTPSQAAEEDYVLQQVVLQGTGTTAGGVGSEVAGKTGTTENNADAWFIGFTPNITTAVWMGYASSEKAMVDFRGYGAIQGGSIPAELWHTYMSSLLQSDPQYVGNFPSVYYLGGQTLTPPLASTLEFPDGMGASTSTTVPKHTTTTVLGEPTTTTTTLLGRFPPPSSTTPTSLPVTTTTPSSSTTVPNTTTTSTTTSTTTQPTG